MKLKIESNALKRIFGEDEIETDDLKEVCIYEDKDVPHFRSRKDEIEVALEYGKIYGKCNIESLTFSNLSQKIIEMVLINGVPKKQLGFYNLALDVSHLSSIPNCDFSGLEELCISHIKSQDGEKKKFDAVSTMQNLKTIKFFNSHEAVDVDDLYDRVPCPENVEKLVLFGSLPNPEIIKKFTGLKHIVISKIDNVQELNLFLSALPLENIESLDINFSNLEGLSLENIARLKSIKTFGLSLNLNTDYNSILHALPSEENLEEMAITGATNSDGEKYKLDFSLLEKFTELERLNLSNLTFDMERLEHYLETDDSLVILALRNMGIKDLNFIVHATMDVHIIINDDIDFGLITPEIARTQRRLWLTNNKTGKSITTVSRGFKSYTLSLDLEANELYHIGELIKKSEVIDAAVIDIENDGAKGLMPIKRVLLPHSDKFEEGYIIVADDISQISSEDINVLNAENKLEKIRVLDRDCDRGVEKRFDYTPEQYKSLYEKVKEITKDIPKDLPDLQKFMIIYRRIGAHITYDYGVSDDRFSKYAKDNVDDSRNMVNGLLRGTCVCAGYADILYNCLREVGIECHKITGVGGNDYHQWNKVKIDGIMYNVDLTWDAPSLARGSFSAIKNCLLGDPAFEISGHKAQKGITDKCPKTYSRKAVRDALEFAMDFDKVPVRERRSLIEKLQNKLGRMFERQEALPEPTVIPKLAFEDEQKKKPSWELPDDSKKEINAGLRTVSLRQEEPSIETENDFIK